MGGAGAIPFGSGPWGGSLLEDTFDLWAAVPPNASSVDLEFSEDLAPIPLTLATSSYVINNGISVFGVVLLAPRVIRLFTSLQALNVLYTVTADAGLLSTDGHAIGVRIASWLGLGYDTPQTVSDLSARTHCDGRRIDLFWTNPTGALRTRIVRRTKNWVFDLTDPHDVVYDGPAITSFFDTGVITPTTLLAADAAAGDTDVIVASVAGLSPGQLVRVENMLGVRTYEILEIAGLPGGGVVQLVSPLENSYRMTLGARVSRSSQLKEQTFYYYVVLTSELPAPTDEDFAIGDSSRTYGLSITEMDSAETFFWKETPDYVLERDLEEDGKGGAGFMGKWYNIMGCWLNLLRGWANAIQLMNDADAAPYHTLSAKNISLGIMPEGYSYDFEVPRRTLTALANVYKRRGTCAGMVRAVSMFTKWDSRCVEFGLGGAGGCEAGSSPLTMWDGHSERIYVEQQYSLLTITPESFVDPSAAWTPSQWAFGRLIGPIGDIVCIADNSVDEVTPKTLLPTDVIGVTTGALVPTDTVIALSATGLLTPGVTFQLTSADGTAGEVLEVLTVTPGVGVTVKYPGVLGAYDAGASVSFTFSVIRGEYRAQGVLALVGGTTYSLTDAQAQWVTNQWRGYYLARDGATDKCLITGNTGNQLQFDTALPLLGGVDYAIAYDFDGLAGGFAARDPVVRYSLLNGQHSFIAEPRFDVEKRNLLQDPFHYLWQGNGYPLLGTWGSGDVGIYITSPVTQHMGRSVGTMLGNVVMLDPNVVAPVPGALVGMFLNPNQNQSQLFVIVGNTATTITVMTDVSSLVVPGEIYYVLNERDANRYRALVARFSPPAREFAHLDTNVRILFA